MSKFDVVRKAGTSGIRYGITTADIIEMLVRWDARHGIDISHVAGDFMIVQFAALPAAVVQLAEEIYGICPDVIRQQLAWAEEMMNALREVDRDACEKLAALDEEALGLKLLEHALKTTRAVALWWDAVPRADAGDLSVA